jgi:multicomponent K+:H+ antiporter subunit A
LCAAGAGVSAWLAGRPFLSALARDVHLPIIGEVHLSTVLLFDLGVFLLVVGAAVLILVALAHQSRRGHRRPGTAHIEVDGKILQPGPTVAHGSGVAAAPSTVTAQIPDPIVRDSIVVEPGVAAMAPPGKEH